MVTLSRIFRARPGRLIFTLLAALLLAPPVHTQQHERGGGGGGHPGVAHGGAVSHGEARHFNSFGRGAVNEGRAFHGRRGGRGGGWWIAGPGWYYYPAPVYAYPDPYWYPDDEAYGETYWYYCPSVGGYYPYVQACPGGWTTVTVGP